jgi:hypothetical protein
MKRTILTLAVALGLTSLASNTIAANDTTWTLNGIVDGYSIGFWDNTVTNGAAISVTLNFSSQSSQIYTSSSEVQYLLSGATTVLHVGDYTFTNNLGNTYSEVFQNWTTQPPRSGYNWVHDEAINQLQNGLYASSWQGFLLSSNTNLISSFALNPLVFPLSTFDAQKNILLQGDANSDLTGAQYINGTVSSYTVSAVPEPSTYALFGLGALVLVIAARSKQKA